MRSQVKKLEEVARLLARGQLITDSPGTEADAEEDVATALAVFGLVASEPINLEDEPFALWPENLPTLQFWQKVQTQWRVGGMGAPTGLDYSGVHAYMSMTGVKSKARAELLAGLQVMERASLDEWAKQR